MKHTKYLAAVLLIAAGWYSCTRSTVAPNVIPTVSASDYEFQTIVYSMGPGDGIDTARVALNKGEFRNVGIGSTQDIFRVAYGFLTKASSFALLDPVVLPRGMNLDSVEVPVPAEWLGAQQFRMDQQRSPFWGGPVERPYALSDSQTLKVTIPARSRVVIDASIDRYSLRCTFRAIFRNTKTGATVDLNGKWNGTLRYNNASVNAKEFPL